MDWEAEKESEIEWDQEMESEPVEVVEVYVLNSDAVSNLPGFYIFCCRLCIKNQPWKVNQGESRSGV